MLNAVILAGSEQIKGWHGIENKALININNETGYELGTRLISVRKKPLQMAQILGLGFSVCLLLGKLSIDRIEKRFSKILNIKVKAVFSEYAEIGNDIDKPSDVIYAEAYLNQKKY